MKPFSEEEDARIIRLVKEYGDKEFSKFVNEFPGRTPRQIRERYNILNPNTKNRDWTDKEDQLLLFLVNRLGHDWEKISLQLSRTPNSVKDRYNFNVRLANQKSINQVMPLMSFFSSERNEDELSDPSQGSHITQQVECSVDSMYEGSTSDKMPILISKNIKGYHLCNQIGCGFTSSVALATRENDCNLYAAKIIPLKKIKNSLNEQLVYNEISICSKINHENIVKYFEHFETPDHLYLIIIFEHCECTLFDYIKQGRGTHQDKIQIAIQILSAIKYLHDNHIAHLDLKIENIFITRNTVKIGDFGFSKQRPNSPFDVITHGTLLYLSPEAQKRGKVDIFKADIYALGVTFYMLATGDKKFYTLKQNPNELKFDENDLIQVIAKECTCSDAERRPSAELIIHFFK